MFKFFSGIVDLIGTVVDFVVSTFELLLALVQNTLSSFTFLTNVTQNLPAYVAPYAMGFLAVSVVLFLVNRGDT